MRRVSENTHSFYTLHSVNCIIKKFFFMPVNCVISYTVYIVYGTMKCGNTDKIRRAGFKFNGRSAHVVPPNETEEIISPPP